MTKTKKVKTPVRRDFAALNVLRDHCYNESKAKGWHAEEGPPNMGNFCANLHGEVSELWEAWRKDKLHKPCDKAEDMDYNGLPILTCAEEEIADIIIRALDTAATLNIDVERAVAGKLDFNRTRPHRNGGKLA